MTEKRKVSKTSISHQGILRCAAGMMAAVMFFCTLLCVSCTPTEEPPIPEGANGYIIENMTLCIPERFKEFDTGYARCRLALTDGHAQVYLWKWVAADTGTSQSYFDRLDALGYGEFYCDGLAVEYKEYTGHTDNSAGFSYVVPNSNPQIDVYLYFVEDEENSCFWMVECRYPNAEEDYYTDVFSTYDELFCLKNQRRKK